MKELVQALLAAGLASMVLSACGENHDILGSRDAAGAPGAGRGGSDGGTATGGVGGAGATAGRAGSASGGTGGRAGGESGGSSGRAGSESGGSSGRAGSESGGAGGRAGGTSGGSSGRAGGSSDAGVGGLGSSGEGGASAGNGSGGRAGSTACPIECTRGGASCGTGEIGWLCRVGFDNQEFTDAGCEGFPTPQPTFCCPDTFYPGCSPCDTVATLAECDARPDCHSVFTDPGPASCACAAVGCCTRFSSCADGALANCDGAVACALATPYCPNPAYVVSTAGSCFEGCVRPEDCAVQ